MEERQCLLIQRRRKMRVKSNVVYNGDISFIIAISNKFLQIIYWLVTIEFWFAPLFLLNRFFLSCKNEIKY